MLRSVFRKKSVQTILDDVQKGIDATGHDSGLHRTLTVRDLTAFGIAAIIGAGIFSTIGKASFDGGPAVIFLFIFTAIACGFSAICYAEFASMVPVSGSAYTYSYVAFGELVAWIIGWDLLMEYAIGNIAVAISWSDYCTTLLNGLGIHIPDYLTMDFLTAMRGFEAGDMASAAYQAWATAPRIGSLPLIMDLPALLITAVITWLVYVGIKESRTASNLMVLLKLLIILTVIAVGAFYVSPGNWDPFMPNGITGILKGISGVFFAYIGFDAISTTAEECKDPQRDLPRGMIYSLIICTVLYIVIALVLTGMVPYTELNVGDPIAFVFEKVNLSMMQGIIAVSAVIAMASVLLVFQMGQPRIWMSMSRDGLLPSIFARVHPRFKTPSFSTVLTGVMVAVPALFMNLTEVTDLTSIGTLFAFVLVNGGILLLQHRKDLPPRKFRVPYVNGKYIVPVLYVLGIVLTTTLFPNYFGNFFSLPTPGPNEGVLDVLEPRIMMSMFLIFAGVLSVITFMKDLSLIPVLGLSSCLYLMTELGLTNWYRFLIWLGIGLVIYFLYGYRHSRVGKMQKNA